MREFSVKYLEATREGMWEDSRAALSDFGLPTSDRVLDVGAGTGALTRVLREETEGDVVALDVKDVLLERVNGRRVQGDATALPFRVDTFDLVTCQALLVNVPDPEAVVAELARVSRNRVGAVEPDNSDIVIDSTVDAEGPLSERAREAYLDGVDTDSKLGAARPVFKASGLTDVTVRHYEHERVVEPPYSDIERIEAEKKADGGGLQSDRETMLGGEMTPAAFDDLYESWCEMGQEILDQMAAGTYRRRERVPFRVTTGRVV